MHAADHVIQARQQQLLLVVVLAKTSADAMSELASSGHTAPQPAAEPQHVICENGIGTVLHWQPEHRTLPRLADEKCACASL